MPIITGKIKCLHVFKRTTDNHKPGDMCGHIFLPRTEEPKLCPECGCPLRKFKIVKSGETK